MTSPRLSRTILMAPGLGWLALFLLVPCLLVFFNAFYERGIYGGVDYDAFTFENFARLIDPLYVEVFLGSARIALITTVLAVLIGYPAAYAITLSSPSAQTRLLILAMLPFWTNYLIRTYAWMVLLNRTGLINAGLIDAGVITEPLPLLYNEFAVILGLVYSYVPFVILAAYASLARLDRSLIEASADLGASGAAHLPQGGAAVDAAGCRCRRRLRLGAVDRQLHHAGPCSAAATCRCSATSSTTSSSPPATGRSAPRCRCS